MFRRTLRILAVGGAVVGVPYVATEWPKLKASVNDMVAKSPFGSGAKPTQFAGYTPPAPANPGSYTSDPRILGATAPSDEPPIVDLAEVFRFDVTPAWVLGRWPRVSASIADDTLHGMRVACISGMRPDDVAGSLTYYFTPAQKCAKITFSGATGDPRRLTDLMTQRFSFKSFPSTEPGVLRYEVRWSGTARSELLIHTAAIVRSSTPLARYEVQLVLTDPGGK